MLLIGVSGASTEVRTGYSPEKLQTKCVTAEVCLLGFTVRRCGNQSLQM
jgi:hypothetical protein